MIIEWISSLIHKIINSYNSFLKAHTNGQPGQQEDSTSNYKLKHKQRTVRDKEATQSINTEVMTFS